MTAIKKERCNSVPFVWVLALSVTASGFKPETFSSVVRCSIQLSYAAIPCFGSAKIQKLLFFANSFYKT